jgi:NAD-dependent SIR2 family protein deacetylase
LVLDFYNQRRKQLKEVQPNLAHQILAELEAHFDVFVITQNVDDLHERAGSTNVLHLHGELLKVRSNANPDYILNWQDDLNIGHFDNNKNQLRPHIVWFGEEVPALEEAITLTETADYFAVIGTSLQVYPAAGLIDFTNAKTPIYYIDPKPIKILNLRNPLEVIPEVASEGMKQLKKALIDLI